VSDKAQLNRVLDGVALDEVAGLTEGLANIPSFSGDEAPAAEYVAQRMRAWGFDEVILQEAERGRPNAIGILRGDGSGIRLMYNGHLDIDPIPNGYDRPLWQCFREGNSLFGVGIGNMKAGDAAMIMAAVALKRSGIKLKGDLIVACVVGELQGGIGTACLLEHGPLPEAAIVPEPTNLQIRTLHAGVLELLVTLRGRAVWAGQTHKYKWVNAIEKALTAMRALHRLRFTHTPHPELPGLPRIHVGSIKGGLTRDYHMWRPAFVADCCTLAIDVRTHPGMTQSGVVADLRACLDKLAAEDPDFQYELELPPRTYEAPWRAMKLYMPPLELPKDHPLVNLTARRHMQVTGESAKIGLHIPGSHAGADSGHLWQRGIPCFNYGPTQHSRFYNEVVLSKLEHGTRVLAFTAADVCTRTRDELGYDETWRRKDRA
jgi:acetylornithine deacetylase